MSLDATHRPRDILRWAFLGSTIPDRKFDLLEGTGSCALLFYVIGLSVFHGTALFSLADMGSFVDTASGVMLAFNPFFAIFVLLGILYFSISIVMQVLRLFFGNYAGLVVIGAFGGFSGLHLATTTRRLLREEVESVAGRTHGEYFASLARQGGADASTYVAGLHGSIASSTAPFFESIIGATPTTLRMGASAEGASPQAASPEAAASVLSDGFAYGVLGLVGILLLALLAVALYRVSAAALRAVGKGALTLRSKLLPGAGAEASAALSWTKPNGTKPDREKSIDRTDSIGRGEVDNGLSAPLCVDVAPTALAFQKAHAAQSAHAVKKAHGGSAVADLPSPAATDASPTDASPGSRPIVSGSRLLSSNPHVRLRTRFFEGPSRGNASAVVPEPPPLYTPGREHPDLDDDEPMLEIPYPRHPLWLYSLLPFLRRRLEKRFVEADRSS